MVKRWQSSKQNLEDLANLKNEIQNFNNIFLGPSEFWHNGSSKKKKPSLIQRHILVGGGEGP
jgi:hypothetical protein